MKNELERLREEDMLVEFEAVYQGCTQRTSHMLPVKI